MQISAPHVHLLLLLLGVLSNYDASVLSVLRVLYHKYKIVQNYCDYWNYLLPSSMLPCTSKLYLMKANHKVQTHINLKRSFKVSILKDTNGWSCFKVT